MSKLDIPMDVFGKELKAGQVICYSVSQGRSAIMSFAVIVRPPYHENKVEKGRWKVQIRDVYRPGSGYRPSIYPVDVRKTSIMVSARIFIQDFTEEKLRTDASVVDAMARLQ